MPARLHKAAAMRALAHPTRIALMETLRLRDALTVSALFGVSPTNCAFHLRVLARFGFVEEAGSGPGRRRPWRALDIPLVFSDVREDAQTSAAACALSDVLIRHWLDRVQSVQAARHTQPPQWQDMLGGSQTIVQATVDEIREMITDIRAVLGRYDGRLRDPSQRPAESRTIEMLRFAQPSGSPTIAPTQSVR